MQNTRWERERKKNSHEIEEIEKKKADLKTIKENEEKEMDLGFKKAGSYLYIIGKHFINTPELCLSFANGSLRETARAVFKNENRIGVIVPEIFVVPPGIVPITVEVSCDGQHFSEYGKTFRYLSKKCKFESIKRARFR